MRTFSLAILTALLWGLAPLLGKLGLTRVDPWTALSLRSFVISGLLLAAGLAGGGLAGLARLDLRSALFIAAEGIAASFLGHLAYYHALKAGEASRVAPITAAFPAVTALAAFLILGERLTWPKGLGVLLVVTGLALLKG